MTPTGDEPLRVEVHGARPELQRDLARVEQLARLLDTRFEIAGVKFGWDSLIGLVPVAGDLATAAMALYPVYLAGRHELGSLTIARMLANVGLDAVIGAVPVLGDIFDIAFKANRRNLTLFRKAVESRRL